MKKKILFVVFFLSIFLFGFILGMYFHSKRYFPVDQIAWLKNSLFYYLTKPRRMSWNPLRESFRERAKKNELSEHLSALGYASGTKVALETEKGVTFYNSEQTYEGFNLYTSSHAPEIHLMDMKGNLLHQWKLSFSYLEEHFREELDALSSLQKPNFCKAHLYENGDVLGLIPGLCLIKLDKNSKLLWIYKERVHHDFEVTPLGSIYSVINKYHKVEDFEYPIMEDWICLLDENGKLQKSVSLLEAFKNSNYSYILSDLSRDFLIKNVGDIFHVNSLMSLRKPLSSKTPFFSKDLILLSLRNLNLLCLLDFKKKEIVWAQTGMWKMQHDASVLGDEKILLFDNRGITGSSRILEINPLTQEILCKYQGTQENPFYSEIRGRVQYLPNDNILITESDAGRCFEVNSKKEIVWEFISPHRVEDSGVTLIAVISNMTRLASNFPLDWLPQKSE